jgi:hypothetical protein
VTFPLYVYGVALRGIPIQVNVLATLLFVVVVGAIALVIWQQRRAERMASVRPSEEREGMLTAAPVPPAPGGAGG